MAWISEEKKREKRNARRRMIYRVAKDYVKNINRQFYNEEVVERLGTFDTSPYRGEVSKIIRDKNGNPDWEKEKKFVKKLKKRTLNKRYRYDYKPTEGDKKRNRKLKYEE